MVNTIQYSGEFIPVEYSKRLLENIVDVWLRKNNHSIIDAEGNTIYLADEVYFKFNIDEAPTKEEIEENFEKWFTEIDEKTNGKTSEEIKISELTDLIYTILGVTENA